MRKLLLFALVLLFLSSMCVIGCGSKEKTGDKAKATQEKTESMSEKSKDMANQKAGEMHKAADSLMDEMKDSTGN